MNHHLITFYPLKGLGRTHESKEFSEEADGSSANLDVKWRPWIIEAYKRDEEWRRKIDNHCFVLEKEKQELYNMQAC